MTIVVGLAGSSIAVHSWKKWTAAEEARDLVLLFKATAQLNQRLALERGSYNELLTSAGPVDSGKLAIAKAKRAKAEEAGREQIDFLARLPAGLRRQVAQSITADLTRLDRLRAEIDNQLTMDGAHRDSEAAKKFQQEMVRIAGEGFTLAGLLEADIAARDSEVVRLIAVAAFGMELRDLAGAHGAWLTQYLVNHRRFDAATLKLVDQMDGRISEVTESLERSILDAGSLPSLVAALEVARSGYINQRSGKYADLAKAAAEGTDPGISAAQWRTWAVTSLSSILAVGDAAVSSADALSTKAIVDTRSTFLFTCAGVSGGALLCLAYALVLTNRVVAPLGRLSQSIREIAAGRLDGPIMDVRYKDEIGDIASAVRDLHSASREMAAIRKERAALRERTEEERRFVLASTAASLQQSIGAVVHEIRHAAESLDTEANQLSAAAACTAKNSAQAVSSSRAVSNKIEATNIVAARLSNLVEGVQRQIRDSSTLVTSAVGEMSSATMTVSRLERAASCIGEITGLISQVAAQTNLLALNATIEAARAGEAGRGFAVVATEVKALASTTAGAAAQITGQIAAVQSVAHETLSAITTILGSVRRVDSAVEAISAAMDGQTYAAQEIAVNMSEASQETLQAATGIGDVASQSNSVEAAAIRLSGAVRSLFEQSARMETEISQFVDRLAAA